MDFSFYYDEGAGAKLTADQAVGGQISGGFWDDQPAGRLAAPGPQAGHRPGLPDLPPLRRVQHRAADGVVPRHRRGTDPGQALLRSRPHVPQRQLRLRLDRDQAGRRRGRATTAFRVFEGALPYRGMQRRPDLGRQHVRGADGAAVRARGEVGPAELGRQPPAVRPRPDRARSGRGATTATGASRRPTTRPAATASTASTRSAWTPAGGYTSDQERTDCRPALRGLPRR